MPILTNTDRGDRDHRADRQGRQPGEPVAGAAERGDAAHPHQRRPQHVALEIDRVRKGLLAVGAADERPGERPGDDAQRAADAERHDPALVAPEHQQFQRVGDRRDQRQRLRPVALRANPGFFERLRMLGDVADMPREVPAADDHQADDDAAQQRVGTPRVAIGQRPANQPARPISAGSRDRGVGPIQPQARRHQCRQRLRGAQLHRRQVDGVDPPHAEQPLQGRVGRNAEHQEHHQRLQVATAYADQRLAAAARGQCHADTEHRPTTTCESHGTLFPHRDLPTSTSPAACIAATPNTATPTAMTHIRMRVQSPM